MSTVGIRRLETGDLPAVLAILEHWNMLPRTDVPDPERTALEPGSAFVAVAGDAVVGIGSYWLREDGWGVTGVLAVHPDWQRQGIGARLQATRMDDMKRRGLRKVHTEADRPEVIEWYRKKFGCRITGSVPKKHAFSLPEVSDWTVLALDLD